jgi:hypothetical protein
MRKMIIASAAAVFIGGASVLTLAVPASAATGSDTPVTVQITGGRPDYQRTHSVGRPRIGGYQR